MPRFSATTHLPSLNFLMLCLLFTGMGAALWHGWVAGQAAVLVFVITGWIVSLCLHEFGHALTAYKAGDHSIPTSGYLTLDPLKYADPFLSLVLPLVYIVIGGLGLPGGAVWINHAAIRSAWWDSAVSAAGPFANVLFLAMLGGLYQLVPHGEETSDIEAALAVLAFFQGTAIVLNLLPIPGLDGFGIIRPFLPGHYAAAGMAMAAGLGFVLIFVVLSVPVIGNFIFETGLDVTTFAGFDPHDVFSGYRYLRFF